MGRTDLTTKRAKGHEAFVSLVPFVVRFARPNKSFVPFATFVVNYLGVTPQISVAYSRTVRSLEKRPMPATLRIDIAFQAEGCR